MSRMPRIFARVVANIAIFCCCVGCDTFHGVSRTLSFDTLPSPEAVEVSLRATPGITQVTRRDIPTAEGQSLYKGKVYEPAFVQFGCRDSTSVFATVELKESNEWGRQLFIYRMWLNHVPTEQEISDARAVIDRISTTLHQRVPNVPASSPADDKFTNIRGH